MTVAGILVMMGIAASCAADGAPSRTPRPTGVSTPEDCNHPPRVTIQLPRDNDVFEWNARVRYVITVSDEEDGESEYEEIPANEVFLEVVYLPGASMAPHGAAGAERDSPGLALMKTTNCFNCHAVNTRVLGPPFSDVARRYENDSATVEMLAERVSNGSSGVWGEVAMLPHPEFTAVQAQQMVQWVLERAADPNRTYYAGTEGAFRTIARPENHAGGVYVLTATYTDRGPEGGSQPRKRGQHTIVVRSR